jgi:hypothetical protein
MSLAIPEANLEKLIKEGKGPSKKTQPAARKIVYKN